MHSKVGICTGGAVAVHFTTLLFPGCTQQQTQVRLPTPSQQHSGCAAVNASVAHLEDDVERVTDVRVQDGPQDAVL